ncbi:3-oxoacyl-ACP reductase FabG [Anaerococcus sp. AGMB09787]|uniref:elongation factor P 5-aminopentanone reductase n=1 Tax=Anaerococcus sp. AGMB09787 TaxID=2922869 RepID=UPI001FAFF05B|nr:3-oxoacyl-ACP reductase FabG [Anaerococcus sp. AGMB09787]
MKTVLITGSSRGIGRAIARRLAGSYNLIINYNHSKDKALSLLDELREINPNVIAVKADVSKEEEVERLFSLGEKNFGTIDVLVNNAGISHFSLIQDTSSEDFERIVGSNLRSVFLTTKRALSPMISQKYGVIINISSIWGKEGAAMESLYSLTKGGINAFTKSLSKELSPSGIRVNAIAPGIVDTDMMRGDFNSEELVELKKDLPLGRFAKPSEVADLLAFLISDEASYITGNIADINGGFY